MGICKRFGAHRSYKRSTERGKLMNSPFDHNPAPPPASRPPEPVRRDLPAAPMPANSLAASESRIQVKPPNSSTWVWMVGTILLVSMLVFGGLGVAVFFFQWNQSSLDYRVQAKIRQDQNLSTLVGFPTVKRRMYSFGTSKDRLTLRVQSRGLAMDDLRQLLQLQGLDQSFPTSPQEALQQLQALDLNQADAHLRRQWIIGWLLDQPVQEELRGDIAAELVRGDGAFMPQLLLSCYIRWGTASLAGTFVKHLLGPSVPSACKLVDHYPTQETLEYLAQQMARSAEYHELILQTMEKHPWPTPGRLTQFRSMSSTQQDRLFKAWGIAPVRQEFLSRLEAGDLSVGNSEELDPEQVQALLKNMRSSKSYYDSQWWSCLEKWGDVTLEPAVITRLKGRPLTNSQYRTAFRFLAKVQSNQLLDVASVVLNRAVNSTETKFGSSHFESGVKSSPECVPLQAVAGLAREDTAFTELLVSVSEKHLPTATRPASIAWVYWSKQSDLDQSQADRLLRAISQNEGKQLESLSLAKMLLEMASADSPGLGRIAGGLLGSQDDFRFTLWKQAVRLMIQSDNHEAFSEALSPMLYHEDFRRRLVNLLASLGTDVEPLLVGQLQTDDDFRFQVVCDTLKTIGTQDSIAPLAQQLQECEKRNLHQRKAWVMEAGKQITQRTSGNQPTN